MSWQACAWAIDQEVGSPARKLVLITLANYANDQRQAWPGGLCEYPPNGKSSVS